MTDDQLRTWHALYEATMNQFEQVDQRVRARLNGFVVHLNALAHEMAALDAEMADMDALRGLLLRMAPPGHVGSVGGGEEVS